MNTASWDGQSIPVINCYAPYVTTEDFEIDPAGRVKPPKKYRDYEGKIQEFRKIKKASRDRFKTLLQFTSPEALLNTIPTYKKYTYKETVIKILNYTSNRLGVFKGRNFFINGKPVCRIPKINRHYLAYHVDDFPKIICFESLDDDKKNVNPRKFLSKQNRCWAFSEAFALQIKKTFNKALVTQHGVLIKNKEEFISKNSGMVALVKQIPSVALLKKNPSLLHFPARKDTCSFTILNYTDHKISMDILCTLRIDGNPTSEFADDSCQIVAYHLEDLPNVIYFEQKDLISDHTGQRFFNQLMWQVPTNPFNNDLLIKTTRRVRQKRHFKVFWNGLYDTNSFFPKYGILKDLIAVIFSKYIRMS